MSLQSIAIVLLVLGMILGIIGVFLRFREGRTADVPHEVFREAMRDAVLLAVEMCRADGQVQEEEIEAIRDFLSRRAPELGLGFADSAINDAIRSTIAQEKIKGRARAIRDTLPLARRPIVLELIEAVASADGELHDGEQAYLRRVGRWLGFRPDDPPSFPGDSLDSQSGE